MESFMETFMGLLIVLVAVAAPFTMVAVIVFFNYKTKKTLAERVPAEQLGEWYKAEAEAKAIRRRSEAWSLGGILMGGGLGVAIGFLINVCLHLGAVLPIALGLCLGGAGMIGGYFLERQFNKKR
jgi:hypothetical protein